MEAGPRRGTARGGKVVVAWGGGGGIWGQQTLVPKVSIGPWWGSLTQLPGTTLQSKGIQMGVGVGEGQTCANGASGQALPGDSES